MLVPVIVSFLLMGTCITEEPRCTQFDFEKNLLQMLVRMEFEMNQTNQKLAVMEDKLAREVQRNEEHNQESRNTSGGLKENQLAKEGVSVPSVSFFDHGQQPTLKEDRPIFTEIDHNDGGSYDVSTGIFTCRVAGVYHFAFNFLSESDQDPYCSMHRNGTQIIFAYAKGRYNSGTMVAYLKLSIGDKIAVVCYEWDKIYDGNKESMWFTGSLVLT